MLNQWKPQERSEYAVKSSNIGIEAVVSLGSWGVDTPYYSLTFTTYPYHLPYLPRWRGAAVGCCLMETIDWVAQQYDCTVRVTADWRIGFTVSQIIWWTVFLDDYLSLMGFCSMEYYYSLLVDYRADFRFPCSRNSHDHILAQLKPKIWTVYHLSEPRLCMYMGMCHW